MCRQCCAIRQNVSVRSQLQAEQAAALCEWVLALLRNYSASHRDLTGVQASTMPHASSVPHSRDVAEQPESTAAECCCMYMNVMMYGMCDEDNQQ